VIEKSDLDQLPLRISGVPVREALRDVFSEPTNGSPDNITKAGCLALAAKSNEVGLPDKRHVLWNAWRKAFGLNPNFSFTGIRNYVDFSGHNFVHSPLRFADFEFGDEADFRHAEWGANADFKRAKWGESCDFLGAKWGEGADFQDAQWGCTDHHQGISEEQGERLSYFRQLHHSSQSVQENGGRQAPPEVSTNFQRANWGDNANFQGAQWRGKTLFQGAQWGSKSNFRQARWSDYADFQNAIWGHSADFRNANWGDHANFQGSEWLDDADFRGAIWGSAANLQSTRWGNRANFEGVLWGNLSSFKGARWGQSANFRGAQWGSQANFKGSQWTGPTHFEGAKIGFGCNFQGAQWGDQVDFHWTDWEGEADFSGKTWEALRDVYPDTAAHELARAWAQERGLSPDAFGWINFEGAKFGGRVVFNSRRFLASTNFSLGPERQRVARDEVGLALFDKAGELRWEKDPDQRQFLQVPQFYGCELYPHTSFIGTKFPDATGSEESASAYRTLKLAFSKQLAIREEQNFFRMEMEEETLREAGLKRHLFKAYKALGGYGFSFSKPLSFWCISFFAFLALYGVLSWLGQCTLSQGPCIFSPEWVTFSLLQSLPLPGLDKLSETARDAFWPVGALWDLALSILLVVHKTISLATFFLLGLAFRNLFKIR
jgi:hypothetical protein